MNKLFKNKYLHYTLLLFAGLFIGWMLFHTSGKEKAKDVASADNLKKTIWTCAMHPQIRMDKPGKCPICGMELIPLNNAGSTVDPDAVHFTQEAIQLANIQTSVVSKALPEKQVRLYGKVQADERLLQSQVTNFPGRIEKMLVNFTGESVEKGQVLAVIYSPELVTAQQEFLEAAKLKTSQSDIYEAAKDRLRQWRISESQINQVEKSGKIIQNVEINSNTTGIVISKKVNIGDYVGQGTALFEVANLSHVWVLFDAYENDLPYVKKGDDIEFTFTALPGRTYHSKITFIDPVLDPVTRVSRLRVEMDNSGGTVKPEMFATGIVKASLGNSGNMIIIPKSAVLWTGKRSIVYVKMAESAEPVFKIREVTLGPALGESYVVEEGLSEGEEIVTQGTFSVDAAAQLEGKPSMMNPEGTQKPMTSMPGMNMGNGNTKNTQEKTENVVTEGKPGQSTVDMNFTMQLNDVYSLYIALKNSFFEGDQGKIKSLASQTSLTLSKIDETNVKGELLTAWKKDQASINKALEKIQSGGSLDEQRKAFSQLSDNVYTAIKRFKLMGKTSYYQFCPMAFNNKGAYWLSETKEIRNPYFGEKMPNCGSTKETLIFK